MKQKAIAKLVTLILLIAFCSCERDFEENHQHNPFSIKDYSLAKANKIARFSNANAKYNDHLKKGRNAKSAKALSDLTIDSTTIREISIGENYTTYTMLVNDGDVDETTFKNLIIEVRPDSTTAYLVKYTPTEEITYVEEHDSYTFEGESEVLESLVIRGPEWNPGTGGYETDQPGGGTSGWVTCTDQLMCRTPYPNQTYGVEHAATAMCISYGTTYLKPVCTTNTTTGGGNPPGGSGTGTGPAGGGTGTSGTNGTPGSNGPVTSPVVPPPPTPCEQLSELNNPAKANIKPTIQNLKSTLSQSGENGMVFEKPTSSTYNTIAQSATATLSVPLIAGPNVIIGVHTHPGTAYPMFSWTDVYNLYETYRRSAYKDEVTYILVSRDEFTFEEHTYAIKVKDFRGFTAKLNTILGVPNYPSTMTLADKQYDLDNNILRIEYEQDSNYERAFLRFFSDYNIDVYKADADLNNWNKLILDPITLTVNQTPCAQN